MIWTNFCSRAKITACAAVLICHCLSLALGLGRFGDFKVYSLRECMIPTDSWYLYAWPPPHCQGSSLWPMA